jgi:PAS domain S-box-containing protein
VNQKTLEILGSPGIEETKKINLLTFPLLVRHGLSKKLEECLQTNELGVYEMNYESKWGKKVWLRAHVKPLANRNTVTGAQVIIDDITEKKQLEEERRRKEERFRLMLEAFPAGPGLFQGNAVFWRRIKRRRHYLGLKMAIIAGKASMAGNTCRMNIGRHLKKTAPRCPAQNAISAAEMKHWT